MIKSSNHKVSRIEFYKTGELRCTICGSPNPNIRFKRGYICSNCLEYVKAMNLENPLSSLKKSIRQ